MAQVHDTPTEPTTQAHFAPRKRHSCILQDAFLGLVQAARHRAPESCAKTGIMFLSHCLRAGCASVSTGWHESR